MTTSPSGKYSVESVSANFNARDSRGYLLNPSQCTLKEDGVPCLTLENRMTGGWFTNNDGVEFLIANAGNSCVYGYEESDNRYNSVLVNCTTKKQIQTGRVTYTDAKTMLALGFDYNGYENLITVYDLSRIANDCVAVIEFENCQGIDYVFDLMQHKNCEGDEFKKTMLNDGGCDSVKVAFTTQQRGIVFVVGEYYRILNGMAFRDCETTYSGNTQPWEGDPRAVYTRRRGDEPDNYDFVWAQTDTIIFTLNSNGKLEPQKRHTLLPQSMTIAEFDALYERDAGNDNVWLRVENIIAPSTLKWAHC